VAGWAWNSKVHESGDLGAIVEGTPVASLPQTAKSILVKIRLAATTVLSARSFWILRRRYPRGPTPTAFTTLAGARGSRRRFARIKWRAIRAGLIHSYSATQPHATSPHLSL